MQRLTVCVPEGGRVTVSGRAFHFAGCVRQQAVEVHVERNGDGGCGWFDYGNAFVGGDRLSGSQSDDVFRDVERQNDERDRIGEKGGSAGIGDLQGERCGCLQVGGSEGDRAGGGCGARGGTRDAVEENCGACAGAAGHKVQSSHRHGEALYRACHRAGGQESLRWSGRM